MESFLFYPTLTPELLESSGIDVEKYHFTYMYQDKYYGLQQKGSHTIKLLDPLDIWKIETEGISLDKTLRVAYPELLKGANGVVPRNADLGICILWTNKKLTQTGIILPITDITTATGRTCRFSYSFDPGQISGDLELCICMYVKKKAEMLEPGEENLINEDGVTVGEIENIVLDFNSLYMEFPIEEYRSADEPLWWVEFSEWEDPKTVDMFTKDSFCLYLNPYYDACPAPSTSGAGNSIKNFDLLVDILAQTYLLLFQRLSDDDLRATKKGINLNVNSVCSILNRFIEDCEDCKGLQWESPEKLLRSLQLNLRILLQGDRDD